MVVIFLFYYTRDYFPNTSHILWVCHICVPMSSEHWSLWLSMQSNAAAFCAGVLDSIKVELKGSKDFSKLYSGIAILGFIASISEPINTEAFAHLLSFLGHRYPKVCQLSKVDVTYCLDLAKLMCM